ncbi:MAG: SPFH domain-containing protein [Candidatus Melainabacteria bacterium]|nr:SPFH domain-containing protein [Candidatus Melainabacteria bacterium]
MDPTLLVVAGVAIVLLFVLGSFMAALYQKVGPNTALIISGGGGKPKIIVGGGSVVLPLLHRMDTLSLEVMLIEVRSNAAMLTMNGVPLFVEGVAQVKVRGDEESIQTAAEQFLGKDTDEIQLVAHETLMGHLRAIIGTMTVEELIGNFDSFASRVAEVSITDLAKMGLTVVSFTIKEVRDSVGYLEALGKTTTAEAKRTAAIGEAEASKVTQIAQAQASRDSAIAQAQATEEGAKAKLAADMRVAESSKNFQVGQAKYQSEVAEQKAAADTMYDVHKAKAEQKLVSERQQIKIIEAQKEVELQQVEVLKRQVTLEADIQKPAEAEQARVRTLALAEQEKRRILAEADAHAYRLKAAAEADATKMKSQAEADATRIMGLANAESARAQGLAEATVIAARGQAEAEAMTKKAEAYRLYNDAAMASMIIEKLPELVQAAAQPLSKIGTVTLLSTSGDTTGMGKLTSDVINVASQGMTMVKGLTGIDLIETMQRGRLNNNANGTVTNSQPPQQKPAPLPAPPTVPPTPPQRG